MRKLVAAVVLSLMTMSISFAGENPKLLKEIKRKLTIDFSKVNLKNSKEDFVIVQFRIVDQEVEIIKTEGSQELQEIMVQELEDMFIKSDSDSNEVHQYKFTFSNEN